MSEPKKAGWLRDEMPSVAAIVDEFCEVFGADAIRGGIAQQMREGTFYCQDFVTGKSYGTPSEAAGVVPVIYQSPNGLPGMMDVRISKTGAWVNYKGQQMSMDEFVAICDEMVRQHKRGKR